MDDDLVVTNGRLAQQSQQVRAGENIFFVDRNHDGAHLNHERDLGITMAHILIMKWILES